MAKLISINNPNPFFKSKFQTPKFNTRQVAQFNAYYRKYTQKILNSEQINLNTNERFKLAQQFLSGREIRVNKAFYNKVKNIYKNLQVNNYKKADLLLGNLIKSQQYSYFKTTNRDLQPKKALAVFRKLNKDLVQNYKVQNFKSTIKINGNFKVVKSSINKALLKLEQGDSLSYNIKKEANKVAQEKVNQAKITENERKYLISKFNDISHDKNLTETEQAIKFSEYVKNDLEKDIAEIEKGILDEE